MKRIITLFLLLIFCITLFAEGTEKEKSVNLELTSDSRTLRVGQRASIKLKISGQAVKEITKDVNNIVTDKNPAFIYQFSFQPSRTGDYKFGPYSLSFDGVNLESNSLKIKALPEWNGDYGTFFRIDCNEINFGESFELVMEIWSKEPLKSEVFELFKPLEAIINAGVIRSQVLTKNGEKSYYFMKSWYITPRGRGEFIITKSFFRQFPDNTKLPLLKVLVK